MVESSRHMWDVVVIYPTMDYRVGSDGKVLEVDIKNLGGKLIRMSRWSAAHPTLKSTWDLRVPPP
eukprot:6384440-Amphidinium_carterae.2